MDGQGLMNHGFASGYTEPWQITGYDATQDVLAVTRLGDRLGAGPTMWFGCRSGRVPVLIFTQLCRT